MTTMIGRNVVTAMYAGKNTVSILAGGGLPTAVYYVDPAGSDGNNGLSQGAAWQTLAKVIATTIPAGAWVLFKGGAAFSGELALVAARHYGTVGKTTLFGSYGTGKATISAATNASNGCSAVNPTYLTVADLILTGTGSTVSTATGVKFESNLGGGSLLPGVSMLRLTVSGYGVDGISYYCTHVSQPSGSTGLLIDSCVVHDCTGNTVNFAGNGISVQGFYGLLLVAPSHVNPVVRNCVVYNCTGKAGLSSHSGDGILLGQCNGGRVEFCQAYNNGASQTAASGPVGIWMYDSINTVIQFCESHHNHTGAGTTDGGGFDLDGGCQNCTLQYNYSHDNDGSGLQIFQFNDTADVLPMSGNTIRYNISENDFQSASPPRAGILIGTAAAQAAPNNNVYGNTIYSSKVGANGIFFSGAVNQFTNGHIANNIFYLAGATSAFVASDSTAVAGFVMIGNLYQSPSVSIKWGATTYTSIATWRAANVTQETLAGVDTSKTGDPLFVGAVPVGTTGGFSTALLAPYQTQSGSPARNAGRDLNALFGINMGTRDLFGNAIPQGSYDIGCYESA